MGQLTLPADHHVVGSDLTGSVMASQDDFWVCKICEEWIAEAPTDKLGRGSLRWPRGLQHSIVDRPDVLRVHNECNDHCRLVLRKTSPISAPSGRNSLNFLPIRVYQMQALKNVYMVGWHEQSLSQVEWYRDRALLEPDAEVGKPISAYMVLEFVQAIATWLRVLAYFRRRRAGMLSGKMWDGATDCADDDSELLGDAYTGVDGHPVDEFVGRVAVDYHDSKDGRSSDSQAHVAALDRFYKDLAEELYLASEGCSAAGFAQADLESLDDVVNVYGMEEWVQHTPAVCLDAASVNVGGIAGSGALLSARPNAGHLQVEKAKAHQLELAVGEAWRSQDYFTGTWTSVTNKTIAHLSVSPKRQFAAQVFSDFLKDNFLKIPSLHTVRWQASLLKSARHTVQDYRALAAHFHEFGKTHAKQNLLSGIGASMRKIFFDTPCDKMMGLTFGRRFEGHTGVYTGTVVAVADKPDDDACDLLSPLIKARYQDGHEEQLCKGQLIELMEKGFSSVLEDSEMYAHNMLFTDAKYLRTTAFVADWRETVTHLSLLIQRKGIHPLKINQKLDSTIAELTVLKMGPGRSERAVVDTYDLERELYKGIPVHGWDEAEAYISAFRPEFPSTLIEQLDARVRCTGPVNNARCIMFDFASIPLGNNTRTIVEKRAAYGNEEVQEFAITFTDLWPGTDSRTTAEKAAGLVAEWIDIKSRYNASVGWQSRTNEQMRSFLYTSLGVEFPQWQIMTNIDGGCPPDNASCERWVSCLNRIKGKLRSRLSHKTTNNLMMISANGPHPSKVDWDTIMHIWQSNSRRGRYRSQWQQDNSAAISELQGFYDSMGRMDSADVPASARSTPTQVPVTQTY